MILPGPALSPIDSAQSQLTPGRCWAMAVDGFSFRLRLLCRLMEILTFLSVTSLRSYTWVAYVLETLNLPFCFVFGVELEACPPVDVRGLVPAAAIPPVQILGQLQEVDKSRSRRSVSLNSNGPRPRPCDYPTETSQQYV